MKRNRIGAILLALLMLVSLVPTATAATLDPNAPVTLTIYKRMSDGVDASGDPIYKYLENVEFTIYEVEPMTQAEIDVHPELTGQTFSSTNPNHYKEKSGGYKEAKKTDSTGKVVFNDSSMPQGLYKVVESYNPIITVYVSDFLVQLPYLDTENDVYIYDMEVYAKNELEDGPDIHKYVTEHSDPYDPTDEWNQDDTEYAWNDVKWIITTTIPLGIGDAKSYVITDELHELLKLDTTNNFSRVTLSYTAYDSSGNPSTATLTYGTHYTINHTAAAYPNQEKFTITLTDAGQKKLAAEAFDPNADYYDLTSGDELPWLETTFWTWFDVENAGTDIYKYLGEEIDNQATLDYENEFGYDWTVDSEEPEVHFGGVRIKKVDATYGNNLPLAGAKFAIFASEADAKAYTDATDDAARATALEKAVPDPNSTTTPAAPWIVTSDSDGWAVFWGLEYGEIGQDSATGSSDYWIVEVEAPSADYELLSAPYKVTVNKGSHLESNAIVVENQAIILLPQTGGMGTVLFTVGGILLIAAGLAIFFVSRRKKNNA